jgi:hypothetical protein
LLFKQFGSINTFINTSILLIPSILKLSHPAIKEFVAELPSDCRILHLDFQNFMGGMPPNPPIQLTP